jgi:hypothetical protein
MPQKTEFATLVRLHQGQKYDPHIWFAARRNEDELGSENTC